jgi:mRNA-degrading endonuclease RelE of RelBE toxin-antitoxin system
MGYQIRFHEDWRPWWEKLDNSVQIRVSKKIKQIAEGLPGRHLELGADYFVEEVGQYRIAYTSNEAEGVRSVYFVGTHKEYVKWLRIE